MSEQPGWGTPPGAWDPAPGGPGLSAAEPPPSVARAVRLMLVRAALSVVGLITLFATQRSLREQIADADPALSGSSVDTAVTFALVGGTVFALLFLALYLWLASQVRRGKGWARIVTLVLSGLSAVSGLASLVQPAPLLSRVVGVLVLALDVAIFVLLIGPRSAEFTRRAR